nr:PREDICTED: uncharacterized protein LOC105662449 [Megachile rotundata]
MYPHTCTRVYVYMYVYIFICTHTYIYVYVRGRLRMRSVCSVRMCVCVCVYVYVCVCEMCARAPLYIILYVCIYKYIYILVFLSFFSFFFFYVYVYRYNIKLESMGSYAGETRSPSTGQKNYSVLNARVSRFLNLLDCTTDDDDDDDGDDGDEDDRVFRRPYHCSAAINTQQWTGTNKLGAFPDVDARSLATLHPPPVPSAPPLELSLRSLTTEDATGDPTLRQNRSNPCWINLRFDYLLLLRHFSLLAFRPIRICVV